MSTEIKIKLFDYDINKEKINLYAVFESFSFYLFPFIILKFTNKEIKKLYDKIINNSDDIKKPIQYIKKINSDHDFTSFNLYFTDQQFKDLFIFLVGHYNKEKQEINKNLIMREFKTEKDKIFDIMDYLSDNSKNKFNNDDYYCFIKGAYWITKLFTIEEKNKFFSYFVIDDNSFYDIFSVSNFIFDLIINLCKKSNDYKDYNFVDTELFSTIGDHDKNVIKPVIEYLKENNKCVNLKNFTNNGIINFSYDKKEKPDNLNSYYKSLVYSNQKKLKKYYFLSIAGKSFILSWVCYLISSVSLLLNIEEINDLIENKEFLKTIYNPALSEKQNIKNVYNSLSFSLYNQNIKRITDILKYKFPEKYEFLGMSKILIQPFILFNDMINLLSFEFKTDKIIDLFKIKTKDNKNKLYYFLEKQKHNNDELLDLLNYDISESSKYFILAVNNNSIHTLDQANYKQQEKRYNYPVFLSLNNRNYKLYSYIIVIDKHHYEFELFSENLFNHHELTEKQKDYLLDNKYKKDCGFKYYYNMLIYITV